MRLGYRLCFAMKLASLILVMSVVPLSVARAEDASSQRLQLAQASPSKSEHQPAGACTPIGLTANGDIVFPWDCREIIEKQRGPISVSLPTASSNPSSHEQSPSPQEQASAPDVRREATVATVATAPPRMEDAAEGASVPPATNAAVAPAKPRLLAKRIFSVGRSPVGRKAQHAGLPSHQASSVAANAKSRDRVALQPGAAQK
jgi:hypothetical protein